MTDFNTNARYDLIQRLQKRNAPDLKSCTATDFNRNFNPIGISLGICIGVIVGMVFITVVKSCDREPQPAAVKQIVDCRDCRNCHVDTAKTYKELKQLQRINNKYDKVMGISLRTKQ